MVKQGLNSPPMHAAPMGTPRRSRRGRTWLGSLTSVAALSACLLSLVPPVAAIGDSHDSLDVTSDLRLLFDDGGGHLTWRLEGPVTTRVRQAIEADPLFANGDGTIDEAEAKAYTSEIDRRLTSAHLHFHGARIETVALVNKRITLDTDNLVGPSSSSAPLEIRFTYSAIVDPHDGRAFLEESRVTYALFDPLRGDNATYGGSVSVRHETIRAGRAGYASPDISPGSTLSRYRFALIERYVYETHRDAGGVSQDDLYVGVLSWQDDSLVQTIAAVVLGALPLIVLGRLRRHCERAGGSSITPLHWLAGGCVPLQLLLVVLVLPQPLVLGTALALALLAPGIILYRRRTAGAHTDSDEREEARSAQLQATKAEARAARAETAAARREAKATVLASRAAVIAAKAQTAAAHARADALSAQLESKRQERLLRGDAVQVIAADPGVEDFHIERLLLIHRDGRTITQLVAQGDPTAIADETVLGGMMVAVQEFAQDSFRSGAVESFSFSQRKVVLTQQARTFLALVLRGPEPPGLREGMEDTLDRLEGLYGSRLDPWSGDLDDLQGIEEELRPLLRFKDQLTIVERADAVKARSSLELFEGYVRVKVAALNESTHAITDATVRLDYDRNSLLLVRVDPSLPMDGSAVVLGTVPPGEKRAVAIVLEPLICQVSYIQGTLTYKDSRGRLQSTPLRRKPVDIVCPIFYTPSTVNLAMLRQLVGKLAYTDERVFALPPGMGATKARAALVGAVGAYDIKLVREFTAEGPRLLERWSYGMVKDTQEELVVRVTLLQEPQAIEVFVASDNLASLTGLLAELGGRMATALAAKSPATGPVLPDIGGGLREQIQRASLLIDRYWEAELGAEESPPTAGPAD